MITTRYRIDVHAREPGAWVHGRPLASISSCYNTDRFYSLEEAKTYGETKSADLYLKLDKARRDRLDYEITIRGRKDYILDELEVYYTITEEHVYTP
jgi:hypothetical protein